jgi:hypothetical protein
MAAFARLATTHLTTRSKRSRPYSYQSPTYLMETPAASLETPDTTGSPKELYPSEGGPKNAASSSECEGCDASYTSTWGIGWKIPLLMSTSYILGTCRPL